MPLKIAILIIIVTTNSVRLKTDVRRPRADDIPPTAVLSFGVAA